MSPRRLRQLLTLAAIVCALLSVYLLSLRSWLALSVSAAAAAILFAKALRIASLPTRDELIAAVEPFLQTRNAASLSRKKELRFLLPGNWRASRAGDASWLIVPRGLGYPVGIEIRATRNGSVPAAEPRFATHRRIGGIDGNEFLDDDETTRVFACSTPSAGYQIRFSAPTPRHLQVIRPAAEAFLANCRIEPEATVDDGMTYGGIVALLREQRSLVFCGAGISRDSGLPLAQELVRAILHRCGASEPDIDLIVRSGLPFEAFMDAVAAYSDVEPLWEIFRRGVPNASHYFAARAGSAVTTNFDTLLEQAAPQLRLVKLHGSVSRPAEMAMTMRQVASKQLIEPRRRDIEEVFVSGPHDIVLMLGYSASDAFDILPAIRMLPAPAKRVVWVDHLETATPRVERLGPHPFGQRVRGWRVRADTRDLVRALWPEAPRIKVGPQWHSCVEAWRAGKPDAASIVGRVLTDAKRPDLSLPFWSPGHPYELGVALRGCGIAGEAYAKLTEALAQFRQRGDRKRESTCLCDLGALHGDAGDFNAAIDLFTDGLRIARAIPDASLMARHCAGLGTAYASLGENAAALRWLDEAVRHAEEVGDKTAEATARVNASRVYAAHGSHELAVSHYDAGLRALEAMLGDDDSIVHEGRTAVARGAMRFSFELLSGRWG
ncbi:MAG TPA: tetratricopeptide repeat protein [Thermoanaerobaculia bacterium]|jgi:hypothetical protein